jgi:CheY-like chemotaxis protein
VQAWRDGRSDLILMDIQMPVMDGVAAAREIRACEAADHRPKTPIIAVTANAMAHQVVEYEAAGMDLVVPKPLDAAKLFEAIERALTPAADVKAVAA